jgi:hypothetical protein
LLSCSTQSRAGNPQRPSPLCSLLHKLLISKPIECANLANLATIDDEAEYFGFAHLHCTAADA